MLAELNISNFAIIDRLYLRLGPGFNALTGETGAGKSIIIDALGALLGSKIGPEFVRHGAQSARVEGQFDLTSMQAAPRALLMALLAEYGLADTEDGSDETVIISREINSSGRTVARVNSRMLNLPTLQQIGELLVDVHGQSEHVSLLRPATHIDLLDEFAGSHSQRRRVAELVARLRATQKALRDLQRDERELAHRADLLTYQVEEIEKADLQPGEDNDLAAERSRLSNSERLSAICDSLYALLIEGADDDGPRAMDDGRQSRRVQAAGSPARDSLSMPRGCWPSCAPRSFYGASRANACRDLRQRGGAWAHVESLSRNSRARPRPPAGDRGAAVADTRAKAQVCPNIDEIIAFGERPLRNWIHSRTAKSGLPPCKKRRRIWPRR